ncbi:type IV toxin-antitoxin system AbiEi family antitoxin [Cellulophaga sp. L1A9]|uniref:type IV toxin-antitoxin system AbiEi family antitoxin n=1 Tax=Cellulophaga sp. L1A9 TaxID=2686362 RepID=UPI00131E48B2|nr:type IV toxin-antitoxin system AbiEi family antitoxin [Cellulophaga sp. L1A9]
MLSTIYLNDFFEALGFNTEVLYHENRKETSEKIYSIDGERVFVEFKNEVRPQNISHFEKTRSQELPVLVASKYITPKAKETLKAKKINYIDSFGNAFLNLDNLKLYVEKNNAKPVYNEYSEVFTPSGGQILFHLLQNPELINATYRHLAEISKVSLGSVSKTINGLLNEDFAVKQNTEKKYQLVRREELLEKWVTLVNEKILPAHKIGSYIFINSEQFKINEIDPGIESCWGGEYGAKLITNYLYSSQYSLFTTEKENLMRDFKMVPDKDGNISVYEPFWKPKSIEFQTTKGKIAVNTLLVYAELVYSGNDRNIETAKIIFDEYIKPNL